LTWVHLAHAHAMDCEHERCPANRPPEHPTVRPALQPPDHPTLVSRLPARLDKERESTARPPDRPPSHPTTQPPDLGFPITQAGQGAREHGRAQPPPTTTNHPTPQSPAQPPNHPGWTRSARIRPRSACCPTSCASWTPRRGWATGSRRWWRARWRQTSSTGARERAPPSRITSSACRCLCHAPMGLILFRPARRCAPPPLLVCIASACYLCHAPDWAL
jgi:hypothetical protein